MATATLPQIGAGHDMRSHSHPHSDASTRPLDIHGLQSMLVKMERENGALKAKLHEVSRLLEGAANTQKHRAAGRADRGRPSSADRKLRLANKNLAVLKRENEKLQRKADSSLLGDQILRLENALSEKHAEAQKLVVENKTLRKIQRAHEKALSADDESERLERDNKHVISENKALKKKLRDAKAKLEQLQRSSDAKFKKINELRQQIKQMKGAQGPASAAALDESKAENETLQEECEKLRKKHKILSKASEMERKKARTEKRHTEEEVAELKTLVERLSGEIKAQAHSVQRGKLPLPKRSPRVAEPASGRGSGGRRQATAPKSSARAVAAPEPEVPAESEEEDMNPAEAMLRRRFAESRQSEAEVDEEEEEGGGARPPTAPEPAAVPEPASPAITEPSSRAEVERVPAAKNTAAEDAAAAKKAEEAAAAATAAAAAAKAEEEAAKKAQEKAAAAAAAAAASVAAAAAVAAKAEEEAAAAAAAAKQAEEDKGAKPWSRKKKDQPWKKKKKSYGPGPSASTTEGSSSTGDSGNNSATAAVADGSSADTASAQEEAAQEEVPFSMRRKKAPLVDGAATATVDAEPAYTHPEFTMPTRPTAEEDPIYAKIQADKAAKGKKPRNWGPAAVSKPDPETAPAPQAAERSGDAGSAQTPNAPTRTATPPASTTRDTTPAAASAHATPAAPAIIDPSSGMHAASGGNDYDMGGGGFDAFDASIDDLDDTMELT